MQPDYPMLALLPPLVYSGVRTVAVAEIVTFHVWCLGVQRQIVKNVTEGAQRT
jgi:hypothetical protein